MTKYLWTGESEFCICRHHITDNGTLKWPVSITQPALVICSGARKVRAIRNCECDEFRPNKVRVTGEEGDMVAIEIQNVEVRKE
jgi:hypothetical protein